jgi:hypothetical protein
MNEATTDKLLIKLRKRLAAQRCIIGSIWSIEDVQQERPDLTPEQAWEVLEQCEHKHDAGIGINWDAIRAHADILFPEPREDIV